MSPTIRAYEPQDAEALARIFFRAVHLGTADHYTARERSAWAPQQPDAATWAHRLEGLITCVAVEGGAAVGFMSVRADGYLDLAFVDPNHAGRGVGRAVLAALESRMCDDGIAVLITQAGLAARGFFLHQGWCDIAR